MTLDGHVYAADFILINDELFNALSESEQRVVARAARIAGNMGRSIQQFNTADGVTKVGQEGMQVYSPSPEELAQFREKAQQAVKEWLKGELGADAEWIGKLEAAVESVSK